MFTITLLTNTLYKLTVDITAGDGLNDWHDGGKGGSVRITGGGARGAWKQWDHGGDMIIVGGSASKGLGGSLLLQSGFSEVSSSGAIGEL